MRDIELLLLIRPWQIWFPRRVLDTPVARATLSTPACLPRPAPATAELAQGGPVGPPSPSTAAATTAVASRLLRPPGCRQPSPPPLPNQRRPRLRRGRAELLHLLLHRLLLHHLYFLCSSSKSTVNNSLTNCSWIWLLKHSSCFSSLPLLLLLLFPSDAISVTCDPQKEKYVTCGFS